MGRKDKPIPSEDTSVHPAGKQLRLARQAKNVSLTEIADRVNYSKSYLSSVENGNMPASGELIQRYEQVLNLEQGELNELVQVLRRVEPATKQQIWYVPHQRNAFFTGRETLLESVRHQLTTSRVVPQALAITGLGGVGKTQLALEYAHRYRNEYRAVVWLDADSPEHLTASFVDLANHLDLPEKNAQDPSATVKIVQRWLGENPGCLIILNNVSDPMAMYHSLLLLGESHILLTTRMQAVGAVAQTLELREMDIEESMLLLLRCAKIIPPHLLVTDVPEAISIPAREISEMMAGLPLALNQAGSYIEQTGCGLSRYVHLLKEQLPATLKADEQTHTDYPNSVAATWTLSFERIAQTNPAAADLLYFCAFLHPDKIYEEFIIAGAPFLSSVLQPVAANPLALHQAIKELRKFSLVRTDPDSGALSIHRLVQVVAQDVLDSATRHEWAVRTMKAVNQAFPRVDVSNWYETWSKCQRYFPQAEACIERIDEWGMVGDEVSQLLNKVGIYLEERTQVREAEHIYQRALKLDKQFYGKDHSTIALDHYHLGGLYEKQGKYDRAEASYRKALLSLNKIGELDSSPTIVKRFFGLLQKMEQTHEVEPWLKHARATQTEQPQPSPKRIPINDGDEHIIYSEDGNWIPQEYADNFNSDVHFTDTPGASFRYDFTGTGIEIISDTSAVRGEVEVYIDDEYVQTINTSRISNQLTQTIIFSKTDIESGSHTLKVIVVNGSFVLDALAVFSYEVDDT